jgi:hypothetical protein
MYAEKPGSQLVFQCAEDNAVLPTLVVVVVVVVVAAVAIAAFARNAIKQLFHGDCKKCYKTNYFAVHKMIMLLLPKHFYVKI